MVCTSFKKSPRGEPAKDFVSNLIQGLAEWLELTVDAWENGICFLSAG